MKNKKRTYDVILSVNVLKIITFEIKQDGLVYTKHIHSINIHASQPRASKNASNFQSLHDNIIRFIKSVIFTDDTDLRDSIVVFPDIYRGNNAEVIKVISSTDK